MAFWYFLGTPSEVAAPLAITQSLIFSIDNQTGFTRTPTSEGSRTTWTWSAWIKRGKLTGANEKIFSAHVNANNLIEIFFEPGDRLDFAAGVVSANQGRKLTNRVFRDPSAWYHFVVVWDSSNATASDRMRIYVNGVRETAFAFGFDVDPPISLAPPMNGNGVDHGLGRFASSGTQWFDGYMAEVHHVDGQALSADSFGFFDSNGVWQPTEYLGTYGTNGFHLDFADNSPVGDLGDDTSGNGNDWTTNNFTASDQVLDTPGTNTNYATINPLAMVKNPSILSNGNLTMRRTAINGTDVNISTFAVSASSNWYAEFTIDTVPGGSNVLQYGVIKEDDPELYDLVEPRIGQGAEGYAYITNWSTTPVPSKQNNGSASSYGTLGVATDVIGVHLNAGVLTFLHNNVSQGVAFSGLTGNFFFGASIQATTGTAKVTANFGQKAFAFTPPSGALKLNTSNLPAPTISNSNVFYNTVLYTGTGAAGNSITDVDFQPGLTWIKSRTSFTAHMLFDDIRGVNKSLSSNTRDDETISSNELVSFDPTGFTVDGGGLTNATGQSYVAWNWKAGTSVSGTTQGSGTLKSYSGSVSTTAGFSIITYEGNGTGGHNIPHHLGATPDLIIVKNRDLDNRSWITYHSSNTSAPETDFLRLESINATADLDTTWNDTSPTSSVFTVGTGGETNENTRAMLAYLWTEIEGYSKFSSYTGNASTDGVFVYCGFKPAWTLIKNTASGGWTIHDNRRNFPAAQLNPINTTSSPHTIGTDGGSPNFEIDYLANGFKLRNVTADLNGSGSTYIFATFAEDPFKTARAR